MRDSFHQQDYFTMHRRPQLQRVGARETNESSRWVGGVTMSDDLTYYAARAAAERRQAMASANAKVRRIHLAMAAEYAARAGAGAEPFVERAPDPYQRTA